MSETIREPARDVPVFERAEVIVLGGGPAGVAAAVAAGRMGVETLLVERYGCLGGLATGGLVIILHVYGKVGGPCLMSGFVVELYDQLKARGVAQVRPGTKLESPVYCPETLKALCLDAVLDAGARLLLHTWGVGAQVEGSRLEAVITESKSGRLALKGQVFVDCSGDADTAAWADVPHELSLSPLGLGLPWRFANVDYDRYEAWRRDQPERFRELSAQMRRQGINWGPGRSWRGDRALFLNAYKERDALDVRHLTEVEIELRREMMRAYDFYRANIPGFEDATILDTASQVGTRESRRIIGGVTMRGEDTPGGRFEDSIGTGVTWFGQRQGEGFDLPYRALVPQKIDNLLYAGRCISADVDAHQQSRVISNCFATGQGAGVAAALAVKLGCATRDVPLDQLQAALRDQGVEVGLTPARRD
jgi:hypothetical protein